MSKHTSGPWHHSNGDILGDSNKRIICEVLGTRSPYFDVESKANARLIEAAPEMLDLVLALAHAPNPNIYIVMDWAQKIAFKLAAEGVVSRYSDDHAALVAKAEGRGE